MTRIRALFDRYREQIAYLFFGGVTTAINIVAYDLCAHAGMPTAAANAVAWVLAVLTAYATNRRWVFESRSRGKAQAREFAAFIGCRVGTGVLDEIIMVLGVDVLGPVILPGNPVLWRRGVKLFSNVVVVVLNYVFSKLLIFRKKADHAGRGEA